MAGLEVRLAPTGRGRGVMVPGMGPGRQRRKERTLGKDGSQTDSFAKLQAAKGQRAKQFQVFPRSRHGGDQAPGCTGQAGD